MSYILVTDSGIEMQFCLKSAAEIFQQIYGGKIIDLVDTVEV